MTSLAFFLGTVGNLLLTKIVFKKRLNEFTCSSTYLEGRSNFPIMNYSKAYGN